MPNGPNRKDPAPRSRRVPNTLGESNRGTHSQSMLPSGATNAPVWQFERNAYSAIGVNGDGAAALCGIVAACAFGSAPFPDLFASCLLLFVVVLMTPPMVRASARGRRSTCPPPRDPTILWRTRAPPADRRAVVASPASTPRHRLVG